MSFDCKVSDTIFMWDGGGGHRYVVLTTPNKDDRVVIVNFESATGRISDGKIFTSSDDENLFKCPTVVPYIRAKIFPVTSLCDEASRQDVLSHYLFCPQTILEQIIKDAFKSQFTPIEVLTELSVQYPDEYKRYCV